MKFSELWLREWVNIDLDSEALLNQITMAGLEVNSVEPVASPFRGVVIGEVIDCDQHPNIDNMWITKVNIGAEHMLDIICSAPNCRQGMKVAVVTINTAMTSNLKIKLEKTNEKVSEGVLCFYSELGITDDNNGIIDLPVDAPIGVDIRDYLKLDDNTIEISVTPNRADCLSIIGLARDVAALNKTKINIPDMAPVRATIKDTIPIQVMVANACPRYLSRVIKDINVKVSTPLWMKEKLRRCGISSTNAVTDITNYVMLELGQPIRVFDKDCIDTGIIVRMAKEGETITLMNNNEVKLNSDTLVIADHSKVLALGGIFSNEHSDINHKTRNVLLECAFFNPLSIIGHSRRYGLYSDASYRYERGVDSALQNKAIERTTQLLINICGGEVGPVIDVTNKAALPRHATIALRRNKLYKLIGHHINDMEVNDILCRLGCDVTTDQDQWQVVAPSWRFDIEIEEDLIEEVARIYGYNNIPGKPIQADLVIMGSYRESDLSLKRVKTLLNDKGYQEVITYSFVDPKVQQLIHPGEEALILPNPISTEMSVMRLSLWTGLLKTIIYNQNRQQKRVRIFETGLRFVVDTQANMGIRQDMMLAGAICGNRHEEHWDLNKCSVDFYDIKGDIESILDLTGKFSEIEFRSEATIALHPGQSAAIYLNNECIGFVGVVHPNLERKLDLDGRTMVFEVQWGKIADRVVPKAQNISRFPANRRDISIVVAENVLVADVLAECKKVSANHVVDINLFDVYRGKGVAEGFKSLAISLIFQDTSHTLKEKEIASTVANCIKALIKRFQASLRD